MGTRGSVVGQAFSPSGRRLRAGSLPAIPARASAYFSFFREFHRKIENSHRPDRGKNGFSHHKRAIPRYLRFSQKFVAILEKLPCQFFGFSLKTSTEPQNTPLNPHSPKNPMPPKVDPYATPVQRRIDALLIVIIAITVAILLLTGSRGHAADGRTTPTTVEKLSR